VKKELSFHLEGRIPKQKIPILIPNNIVTIGYFYGQANVI